MAGPQAATPTIAVHVTPSKNRYPWRQRIGLFNARAAAFLFEVAPIQLLGAVAAGPVIAEAIRHYDPWTRERGEAIGATTALLVHAAVDLAWFLARDAVPGLSWGKRLMGLRVIRCGSSESAGLLARAARNVLLAVPFFVAIEGIVSLVDARAARRIGDWMTGTCVQHRDQSTQDHGLAVWQLALGLAIFAGCIAVQPWITESVFNVAYGR